MSEKTSVLLSDVTIKGNITEKEKLMTDSKIEGDITAETLQTYEGSKITGNINSSNVSLGGVSKGNINSDKVRIKSEDAKKVRNGLSIDYNAHLENLSLIHI